jgi:cytochrome c-type biogenesis protein CcmH/NrfF
MRASCLLFTILLLPSLLFAQSRLAENELSAQKIFEFTMSPFCPGRSLKDCPSSQATELKNQIRQEIRAGKSEDEIFNELSLKYGESIRAVPDSRGVGVLAWIAPFAFLFFGALILTGWLLRKKGDIGTIETAETEDIDPELTSKIERDLI